MPGRILPSLAYCLPPYCLLPSPLLPIAYSLFPKELHHL